MNVGPFVADVDFLHAGHVQGGRSQEVVVELDVVAPVFDEQALAPGSCRVRSELPRSVVQRVFDEPLRIGKFTRFEALGKREIHLPWRHDVDRPFDGRRRFVRAVSDRQRDVVQSWSRVRVVELLDRLVDAAGHG